MENERHVTYRQLETLLTQLGFAGTERDDGAIAYRHVEVGSLILLPPKRGDRKVREADVVSAVMHLVGRGHLEEVEFEVFLKSGAMPASTA